MNMQSNIYVEEEFEALTTYNKNFEKPKRVSWNIEDDVIGGRVFNVSEKFLPDSLSRVHEFTTLNDREKRLLSQIQGRTYFNMYSMLECFINRKILELSQIGTIGDQVSIQSLVRYSREEIKQQVLRTADQMCERVMMKGYKFMPEPNEMADTVMSKSNWAVLALALNTELFSKVHYSCGHNPLDNQSKLYKDIFLYHWREESQHATSDRIEWISLNERISADERDLAVNEFAELIAMMGELIECQAKADADYFVSTCAREIDREEVGEIEKGLITVYGYQYIFSGTEHPHFGETLGRMITPDQADRINAALDKIK